MELTNTFFGAGQPKGMASRPGSVRTTPVQLRMPLDWR